MFVCEYVCVCVCQYSFQYGYSTCDLWLTCILSQAEELKPKVEDMEAEKIDAACIVQLALDGWGDMKYENFETRATVQRCKDVTRKVLPPTHTHAMHARMPMIAHPPPMIAHTVSRTPCSHACTHARRGTSAPPRTHPHMFMPPHVDTPTPPRTHSHVHATTRPHTHTHTHKLILSHARLARTHARTHAAVHLHPRARTHMSTHPHTHTHTHVHSLALWQLCEAKTKAIVAKLTPLLNGEHNIEDLIRPIMEAENAVYTAYKEETVRRDNWAKEYPPIEVKSTCAYRTLFPVTSPILIHTTPQTTTCL